MKLPPFSTLFEGLMHIPAGLSSRQILLFPAVQFGTGRPAESLIWKERVRKGQVEEKFDVLLGAEFNSLLGLFLHCKCANQSLQSQK